MLKKKLLRYLTKINFNNNVLDTTIRISTDRYIAGYIIFIDLHIVTKKRVLISKYLYLFTYMST